MSNKYTYTIGALIVLCVLSAGLVYYLSVYLDDGDESALSNYGQGLNETINNALRDGQVAGDELEALMARANNEYEKAQVETKYAFGLDEKNESVEAIKVLKNVAANETYPSTERAFAIESMGRIYNSEIDPRVFEEIFSESPYSELRTERISISVRNLYEYAAALYPLATAELKIAEWYVDELLKIQVLDISETERESRSKAILAVVEERLNSSEEDIARMRRYNLSPDRIATALNRRAVIEGDLRRAGIEHLLSFELEPEEHFKESIAVADENNMGSQALWSTYHYAKYLNDVYGSARAVDIGNLLARIEAESGGRSIEDFLIRQKDLDTNSYNDILALANVDGAFKQYLLSLGWNI